MPKLRPLVMMSFIVGCLGSGKLGTGCHGPSEKGATASSRDEMRRLLGDDTPESFRCHPARLCAR